MQCEVCCENINRSNHKQVTCAACPYIMCHACCVKYLTSVSDAHCMNCKHVWGIDFLTDNFTKTFINNEYKRHRGTIIYEREKSMLPETTPLAEQEFKRRKLNSVIHAVKREQTSVKLLLLENRNKQRTEDTLKERAELNEHYHSTVARIENGQEFLSFHVNTQRPIVERRVFIKACPAADCRGFLSSQYKCGMCSTKVCSHCFEIKVDEEHKCDEDNVKTADMIRNDSKPCPKCSTVIFKISGCSQMFCTICHTAFDWLTLRVTTGPIHNPHYFEYQRLHNNNNQRLQDDVGCERLPRYSGIQRALTIVPDKKVKLDFETLYMMHNHIEDVELPRYNRDVIVDNRDLRIDFILNSISEDDFKRTLQQREKRNNKKRDIYLILQTYQHVVLDIFTELNEARSVENVLECYEKMKNIRDYTNTNLGHIKKRYNNVVPSISDGFRIG